MKKTILRKYAQVVAKCGLNVQKGQDVWIRTSFEQPEFVQMCVEECYKLGARDVLVDWTYQPLTKVNVRYKKLKDLGSYESWMLEKLQYHVDKNPCCLFIESEDPDGLKGINIAKMTKAQQMIAPTYRKYRDQWENRWQWCIIGVPGVKWAKKVFPGLSKSQAVEKLWESILSAARITEDPVQAWADHNKDLHDRCDYLNKLGIEELCYKGKNGTDFKVGMIPQGVFNGGGETSLNKIFFNPNMPTEETFTSPMKNTAEGIVYSTKPLSYQGQLIDRFWIRFKDGKAVEWDAETGKENLTKIIELDEGSAYLGEVAIVPVNSPISQSNILYYNTLYDENAACHLALGFGFADCIKGFENMTLEEVRKLGVNYSNTHVDFMIGYEGLDITAKCRNGKTVQILKNGNWAF